jgi:hypothetical protein
MGSPRLGWLAPSGDARNAYGLSKTSPEEMVQLGAGPGLVAITAEGDPPEVLDDAIPWEWICAVISEGAPDSGDRRRLLG